MCEIRHMQLRTQNTALHVLSCRGYEYLEKKLMEEKKNCRSKLHDDEPSNFDDAKSPSD